MRNSAGTIIVVIFALLTSSLVKSDGISIDKVYMPYVQLLEKEIEFRSLYQQDSKDEIDGGQRHILGYGQSISDNIAVEAYLVGFKNAEDNFKLRSYELELMWQLTEQGEFSNDYGVLVELEKSHNENIWEVSSTLIALHEWNDWILTGNLSLIFEGGKDIDNEWETALSSQLRYRYKEAFEPAIELYKSQGAQGLGPVITGLYRLGGGRKIFWEFGVIFGIDSDTPEENWKINVEYEFR